MPQKILHWQNNPPQSHNCYLPLEPDQVNIWQANLNLDNRILQGLQMTLSKDEQHRADRFYFPTDKDHYIAARGILRSILARYLDTNPELIKFTYTPEGKPYVDNNNRENSVKNQNKGIQFNLSHSQNLALYAIGIDRPLGIDLEYCRSIPDVLALAKRWFSASEYEEILDRPNQEINFFRFWTAKEAYLKATGIGLRDLSRIEITITPDNSLQFKTINGTQELALQWSLLELNPAPGYVGALAMLDLK